MCACGGQHEEARLIPSSHPSGFACDPTKQDVYNKTSRYTLSKFQKLRGNLNYYSSCLFCSKVTLQHSKSMPKKTKSSLLWKLRFGIISLYYDLRQSHKKNIKHLKQAQVFVSIFISNLVNMAYFHPAFYTISQNTQKTWMETW